MTTQPIVLYSLIALTILSLLIYIYTLPKCSQDDNITYGHGISVVKRNITKVDSSDVFSQCPLPKHDSYGKEIMQHINLRQEYSDTCNHNFQMMTKLEGFKAYATVGYKSCWGRCVNRQSDKLNAYGEWKDVNTQGTPFDCEVVETRCSEKTNGSVDRSHVEYGMLHYQAIPIKSSPPKIKLAKNAKQYSVHVILIDSLSTSQADRTLPKTMRYLEKSMEGITFPYINKVADNSRPNAIALWYGRLMELVDRAFFDLPNIEIDLGEESCYRYMDNETSLFSEYKDYGYKTMMADDYNVGVMNVPNCDGFKNQPTDHFPNPFTLELVNPSHHILKSILSNANCFYSDKLMRDHLLEFINAYPNDPMFSWTWLSKLGHDNQNTVMRSDIDFFQFFHDNREKLDNSFLVFMGDHGMRIGDVTNTEQGAMDVNNPLFTMVLPRDLRNNTGLVEMMKENSKKLHTHFDLRATFLDILKYQPLTNYRSQEELVMENEKGSSLMRKMEGERSCRTLPIPLPYCICQYPRNIKIDSSTKNKLGQEVIKLVNERLAEHNASHLCNQWNFKHTYFVTELQSPFGVTVYSIKVRSYTVAYNDALLVTQLTKDKNGVYSISQVTREDCYRNRGVCASSYASYLPVICDCV